MTFKDGYVKCDRCGRVWEDAGETFANEEEATKVVTDPFGSDQPWMEEDGKHFCLQPCFPGDSA